MCHSADSPTRHSTRLSPISCLFLTPHSYPFENMFVIPLRPPVSTRGPLLAHSYGMRGCEEAFNEFAVFALGMSQREEF